MRLDRRAFLAATAAMPLAAAPLAASPAAAGAPSDLAWLDATATADLIRRKQISPREAVAAAIRRVEALNPRLGAVVTEDFERALKRASGPLSGPFAGVPTLIKDLADYQGLPTRMGSRLNARAAPAAESSPLVERLLALGFVPLGKSATSEFGFLPTTEPVGQAPARNPWNLGRSSGGSSGGAGSAVASGMVPFAHGTDAGGSIRIPAACCGLVGLKPSRGRTVGTPAGQSLVGQLGLSRSVRDTAALLAATEVTGAGAPLPPVGVVAGPAARRLKIGWLAADAGGRPADPAVAQGVRQAAELCGRLGHTVEAARWPEAMSRFTEGFLALWASDAHDLVGEIAKGLGRRPTADELEPFTLNLADYFTTLDRPAIDAAWQAVQGSAAGYLGWLQQYDVILTPVLGGPPAPLGFVSGDVAFPALAERLIAYVGYTPIVNVTGATALSLPLARTADGLPIGVQFASRPGGEATLLALAYELEQATPWAKRRPPVKA